MLTRIRIILIILGLTLLFLGDELFILVVMKPWIIWDRHPSLFNILMFMVTALNFLLAIVVYRTLQRKPTTGKEGMIGEQGVVMTTINGKGMVFVHGEIWSAESDEIIHKYERVIVEKVEGMILWVKKYNASNANQVSY